MRQTAEFDPSLIRRFDIPGPRYTSYPTADRFLPVAGDAHLGAALGRAQLAKGLSLYVHVPFCDTACFYCACNKIATKDHSVTTAYLAALIRELDLQCAALPEGGRELRQLHFGGGTPTFLAEPELRELMAQIRARFVFDPEGEFSIEIDPRKVSPAYVESLAQMGFNRFSIGIQDFDERVQRAVNRIQSEAETAQVFAAARAHGIASISGDLIYGLPFQNTESFLRTLERVLALSPDRLALYNYAHLPTRFMPQRRISEADLPSPDEKLRILGAAIEMLQAQGYVYIGMDHFARPGDELAVAQRQGCLQRNFQGYSTHAECEMLAIGVTAISKVGGVFSQNERSLEKYYEVLEAGRLPVLRGWELTAEDGLRNEVIQRLMCDFSLDFGEIGARFALDFAQHFASELAALQELAQAGLVTLSEDRLEVTDRGRMLVRVVAMVFDEYLRKGQVIGKYSKVI